MEVNNKKFFYDYEDYEDGKKNASTLAAEILSDPELPKLNMITVGCWGESYDNPVQEILDVFVENKEKFSNIGYLFVGDMDYEECEVSWIEQGSYNALLKAWPQLKSLTIKGSQNLELGIMKHDNLESLKIICGGLPKSVLNDIRQSELPNLKELNLYIGVENYGFDGDIEDIAAVINNPSLKKLQYLGLGDSEIQDEIVKRVMELPLPGTLTALDFSNGTLSDIGGQCLLNHQDKLKNLKLLNLSYNFLSDKMVQKLEQLPIEKIDLSNRQKNDEEYGKFPLLTE